MPTLAAGMPQKNLVAKVLVVTSLESLLQIYVAEWLHKPVTNPVFWIHRHMRTHQAREDVLQDPPLRNTASISTQQSVHDPSGQPLPTNVPCDSSAAAFPTTAILHGHSAFRIPCAANLLKDLQHCLAQRVINKNENKHARAVQVLWSFPFRRGSSPCSFFRRTMPDLTEL